MLGVACTMEILPDKADHQPAKYDNDDVGKGARPGNVVKGVAKEDTLTHLCLT
jgi:hypothetical protein